ncbi:glycosyltransferase family 87 protein [Altererythrobacter sp. Root672]|uniref:glycosyltransferase family 87 protein n=1 Tax=Altererythrobacter sp. Root672 TaxID=1736584 RepID=UPI0006F314D0|nr:glycosyltransferase family 87 protein [Altererythrobacter sp. Root672]KRA83299.1 hypothetical protein ASD76_04370 [Altererythrobacter sp. Root672]
MKWDFFRKADWLDRSRATVYLGLFAAINIASLVVLVATSHGGVDRNGSLLGSDFLSFWAAGQMLHHGAPVYDAAAHIAAQRAFYAPEEGYMAFFYPPSFLPFCWPLGLLGYFPALVGWLVATGTFYVFVVRKWLDELEVDRSIWLLLAASPPVLLTITHGQTSFLLAGMLGLGAILVPRAPILAGALFGLATIKPQFGLLLPLALLMTREWRVIMAAGVTALALAAISTLVFGLNIWGDWYLASDRAQSALVAGEVAYAKMMSPLAALKLLGAPNSVAFAVQGIVALSVAGAVAWAAWGKRWNIGLAALVLAGAPLATPFVLDYDMVLLAFPLIYLAATGFRDWERLALAFGFVGAAIARPLALHAGVPVMTLITGLLFVVLTRRMLVGAPVPLRAAK